MMCKMRQDRKPMAGWRQKIWSRKEWQDVFQHGVRVLFKCFLCGCRPKSSRSFHADKHFLFQN